MKREDLIQDYLLSSILIYRNVMLLKKSRFSESSLNRAQLELLYILDAKGKLTLSEVAETTQTTSGAVTQLINRLVTLGYLVKQNDSNDKRVVSIEFTSHGSEKFSRIKDEHLRFIGSLLGALTDQEVKHLQSLQHEVLKALK
jgi:DNA-binding MarR family transcriptional regulator